MANLYQIDREIMACVDAETGEIIDFERLSELQMEREAKVEGVALYIKNLQADALAYKAEKDAFAYREQQAQKKVDGLKKWLATALDGQKFSTAKCAISFRRSEQVDIPDESKVPAIYMKEVVASKPDKVAIKNAIKAGLTVEGCSLVENLNTQIK